MSQQYYGTGRRKTSSARVFISLGTGKITVNKYDLNKYFNGLWATKYILQPLKITNTINLLDIYVTVNGGGINSQVIALRHGLTRALIVYNKKFRNALRSAGFVERDSRKVERKKVGCKKARRSPQFSKR
ncbi:30S ribosomal protein S9 [Candidatus Johnevansia muelleri]|uniref:Small ribosomal subunit protein uS9 n=1 Tax=Candidatus Johnevansia muelleri TaxID=1495769 RepID=A0A078KBR4_9GAMM|nr:30S ribosomal protein S9 [Candidatus Evansia muelleri]